tara:strand:- start:4484 stop:5221 length:738 start_codon:yes stop_codon:yes gene_type:complete
MSYVFEVVRSGPVTPNMFRVRLGGSSIAALPADCAGGYLKLRIPTTEGKSATRTYTIRAQGPDYIDIDFALHVAAELSGPATAWALAARPGDTLEAGGPGPSKPLPEGHGSYIIAGDMTALPAISVNLETLSDEARADAFVEVQSEDDIQDLDVPRGVRLHWLVNPSPGAEPHLLENAIRELTWPSDLSYAWVATEFKAMKNVRTYLRSERSLSPQDLYISSYWKRGLVEDDHRIVKSADAKSDG